MEQVVWGTNTWLREGLPRASHSPDRMGLPKDKGIFDPIKLIRIISIIIPEKAMASHSVLLPGKSHGWRSLEGCSTWGRREWTRLSNFTFTFHFHALEKEMATHSCVLAWRIPGTAEPGGLPSMGSHKVGHDWSDLAAAAAVSLFRLIFLISFITFHQYVILIFFLSLLSIFLNNPIHISHAKVLRHL